MGILGAFLIGIVVVGVFCIWLDCRGVPICHRKYRRWL